MSISRTFLIGTALLALAACGNTAAGRAATGGIGGAVVGRPAGAVVGGTVGAATAEE